ncbi:MAG: DUF2232 domain-containing protein [Thermoanaerobaculia bacterium]|nr:DUF2232 domain-containing protein [Thermoanaerobaculia bacterium]
MPESTTRLESAHADVASTATELRKMGLHALAAAVMYVTPLILFVPAAFITAGIRFGVKGLVTAIGGAALVLLALASILGGWSVSPAEVSGIARLVATVGIPAWIATLMISRRSGIGSILVSAVLASAVGYGAVELVMRSMLSYSPYGAIQAAFEKSGGPTIELYREMGISGEALDAIERFSTAIASTFVPSLMLIITATMFLFSVVMLSRLPWSERGAPNLLFRGFTLPEWVLFGFIVGGLSPFLDGMPRMIGLNVLAIVLFLYVVQGLAVFRGITLKLRLGALGLFVAWAMLAFLTFNGVGLFFLFLAGLFDPFFDFRNFRKKGENDEGNSD